jgi:beta-lactamase regulating signal transducer with metallopeptidase domain
LLATSSTNKIFFGGGQYIGNYTFSAVVDIFNIPLFTPTVPVSASPLSVPGTSLPNVPMSPVPASTSSNVTNKTIPASSQQYTLSPLNFNTTPNANTNSNTALLAAILGVVALLIVAAIILLIVFLVKKRKNKKLKSEGSQKKDATEISMNTLTPQTSDYLPTQSRQDKQLTESLSFI